MRYREVAPSEGLSHLIACYWEFAAADSLPQGHMHTIPVDGCVSIGYARNRDGQAKVVYVGPRLEPLRVPVSPGDTFWGIRFLPGSSWAAIGASGSDWFGKSGLLAFTKPELSAALLQSLHSANSLEDAIPGLDSAVSTGEPNREVMQGVYAITASCGTIAMAELPGVVGLSERQFQRLFRKEVGLTPKQYARICRLRASAIQLASGTRSKWAEIAAERGYTDQSHLIREFQALFGISPGEFERQFLAEVEHGPLEWGRDRDA